MPRHFCRASAQRPHGYCFASVFVPISDENRDGSPVVFCKLHRKASAVSPVPARIAPPRWGTRGRRCECFLPSARRERLRKPVWLANCTKPRSPPHSLHPDWGFPTQPALTHTSGCVLANLSKITRKMGRVNGQFRVFRDQWSPIRLLLSRSPHRAYTESARQRLPPPDCA